MEEDPKIFTAADLVKVNQLVEQKLGVSIDQMQEMSYRKGCHQTASMIYDAARGLKSKEDILNFIGALEDVLSDFRGDSSPHHGLLHEAIEKALLSR